MGSARFKFSLGLLLTLVMSLSQCSSQVSEFPPATTDQMETTTEFQKSSSGSTEGSSEITSGSPSTPMPTSATPPVPSTAVPIIPDSSSLFFCPCDYYLNSCEFNCCCDPNCSDKEKSSFTNCIDEESIRKYSAARDARRCYKRNFLYRNRTMYRTEIPQPGLFCVVSENVHQEEEFPTATMNLSRITEETKAKYHWHPKYADDKAPLGQKDSYKYAHQILLVKSNRDSPTTFQRMGMVIPSTAFNSECNAETPVNFLQNQESSCQFQVLNLSLQCETTPILNAATFLQDLMVVGDPSLNLTNLVNFTVLQCPIRTAANQNPGCVNAQKLLSPKYNPKTLECLNVLKGLTLVFKHTGVTGIVHVMAHVHYSNHTTTGSTTKISQKFSTVFEWENPGEDDVHHHPLRPLSGNPGYIIGKPILIGTSEKIPTNLVTNKTGADDRVTLEALSRRKLIINPNFGPMTVLSPQYCDGERKLLLFGYDTNVNCLLDIVNFTSCQALQLEIGKIFLGIHPKDLKLRYVATLGNPDVGMSSHWLPFLTSGDPFKESGFSFKSTDTGCDGIVTSMNLHFLFAHVGSVHFPQLKILGALAEFGHPTSIPRKNENTTHSSHIFLTTTAKFTDVTPAPVTPLPKWPIISIKLPQDFFYPFSITTGGSGRFGIICPIIVLLQLLLIVVN